MKTVIAIDSFKGSLSAQEAGKAVADGIRKADPKADIQVFPIEDGGEGTVHSLILGMGAAEEWVTVTGPLGEPRKCRYGRLNGREVILEMAEAAGLTLVPEESRNPLYTSTYGVGEMIRCAILAGYRNFIVGIGGSATNDGGVGMLQALGYEFLDKEGKEIAKGAIGLESLAFIKDENVLPELKECHFKVACDVTNPLCGEKGCSAVYGPQKGATPQMIKDMDEWLSRFAALTKEKYPDADEFCPGSGAAGGLGFAFLAYTNACLQSGIEIVMEVTGIEKAIREADLVITGEGRLDRQTVMGKAPVGVAGIAKKYGKTVAALGGSVSEEARFCNEKGIDAFFSILRGPATLEEAMQKEAAKKNMEATAEQVYRLFAAARKFSNGNRQ